MFLIGKEIITIVEKQNGTWNYDVCGVCKGLGTCGDWGGGGGGDGGGWGGGVFGV